MRPLKASHLAHTHAISSTDMRRDFGEIGRKTEEGPLAVTVYGEPRYVLLKAEQYDRLVGNAVDPIDQLSAQFDQMVAQMQTPAAQAAAKRLFTAFPAEFSKVHKAARRRRTVGI
ncbi:MAG: type II toxin-antitoxin system prevent-host-death family antitoxin [Nevskiales bacterium]